MEAEFGAPKGLRPSSFDFFDAPGAPEAAAGSKLYCAYVQNGLANLGVAEEGEGHGGRLRRLDTPFSVIAGLRAGPAGVVFIGGASTEGPCVVRYRPEQGGSEILRRSTDVAVAPAYLSVPEAIEFPTEGGLTAHAFYYRPQNPDFVAPKGELPPLRVVCHGGPVGATTAALNLRIQYWTSRGFAVLDVNYGGSIGYGRSYRRRLRGKWGVVDVDDCVTGVRYLVAKGEVDGNRTMIMGGSAGGYTTLAALAFRNVFRAGASHFGVSDLEVLAKETHKFESRYLDSLIGRYPEDIAIYHERSPLYHADGFSCPVIFFQGLEDKVVPPNQAELMVAKLRAKGIPVAYVPFAGEGHGFRRAENIKRALEAEFYFISRVFGFQPAEDLEPVPIENM